MEAYELRKIIKEEVAKQVNVILAGQSGNNTQFVEDISNLFAGMSTIPQRPVMHPYGLSSRAPANTTQVVGRVGDHFGNRMVLGHRDANRPSINQGEVVLYNSTGQAVYLNNGKIQIGSKNSASPVVLGDVMMNALMALVQAFTNAATLGQCAVGPVFLDAGVRTALTQFIQTYITTTSTNVVSKLVFTERGS